MAKASEERGHRRLRLMGSCKLSMMPNIDYRNNRKNQEQNR
nr:hypothetical protein [Butyrivibrio sp.]